MKLAGSLGAALMLCGACGTSPPPAPEPAPASSVTAAPKIAQSAAPSASASASAAPIADAPGEPVVGTITPNELPSLAVEFMVDAQLSPAAEKAALAKAAVKKGDLVLKDGTKIAGPCWDIPLHSAVVSHLAAPATPPKKGIELPQTMGSSIDLDLDGDGVKDVMVNMGSANISTHYEIYIRRGTCGYHLGRVALEGAPEPTTEKQNGLFVLEHVGVCRKCCTTREHVRMAWTGKEWQATKAWSEYVGGCNKGSAYPVGP